MANTFKDFLSSLKSKKTQLPLSKSSINSYAAGIKSCSKIYFERNIISKPLTEMNLEEFRNALKKIEMDSEYKKRNKTQNNFDSATLHNYEKYLVQITNNPKIDFKIQSVSIVADDEQPISPFILAKEFIEYENYCKSLLAKPFVILAGNSGTGKTKISTDFATWLGIPDSNGNIFNKLVVPVGSDWTDNTKILGFYNPIAKKYESSKILDFILVAEKNPTIPFFLILDEMNLSHVERYFSDFLSAMESKEPMILYSKNDCLDSFIPETITLPENLFVTGTVNIDETTYMFSPKVLDRANVIEFTPSISSVLDNYVKEKETNEISPINNGMAEAFMRLAIEVRNSEKIPDQAIEARKILEEISNVLENTGFEFAYRTTKEIRLYVNASYQIDREYKSESTSINKVMDEEVLQKILPKIHGNKRQIEDLLKKLSVICEENKLDKSLKKINLMLNRLEKYQFASFI